MTKTIYLVDTENVQYTYEQVIPNLKPGDELILFCTEHTLSMQARFSILEKISRIDASLKVIACESGHNALDFQLSSYLGWLIRENYADLAATKLAAAKPGVEPNEYVIVSGDRGYDPLRAFWADYGYKVTVIRPVADDQDDIDDIDGLCDELYGPEQKAVPDLVQDIPPFQDPSACTAQAQPNPQITAHNNTKKDKHRKKPDDGPARGIKSFNDCCRDYEKSIRGITGYYGKWAETISSAMAVCVKMPAKARAPKYRSILIKKLGKENGPAVYKKTKPLLDDFVVNGPWPWAHEIPSNMEVSS